LALESMAMHALLLQGADHPYHHPVLLWAVRGDEFLFEGIIAHQTGVIATGKYQTVVRAQQERFLVSDLRTKVVANQAVSPWAMVSVSDQLRRMLSGSL
jgi:hypothetical protein